MRLGKRRKAKGERLKRVAGLLGIQLATYNLQLITYNLQLTTHHSQLNG